MTALAPRRRSWLWLQGLLCGAALSVATAPAVLVGVLLAPGLVAYAIERTDGKPLAEGMLLLGLATTFLPLRLLWEGGHSMDACMALLTDPSRTGLSWLAGAAGWMMGSVAQMAARHVSDLATRRRITLLTRERADLVAEWGPLVRQPAPRR